MEQDKTNSDELFSKQHHKGDLEEKKNLYQFIFSLKFHILEAVVINLNILQIFLLVFSFLISGNHLYFARPETDF